MGTPFKERINATRVARIGDAIAAVSADFDQSAFVAAATTGLDALELKARVAHVSAALATHLPPFPASLPLLLPTMGQPANPDAPDVESDDTGLRGFGAWPLVHYVEVHGIEHPEAALDALGEMTGRMSAEFAIRPYVLKYPDLTWPVVDRWAAHADVHRRRLASEGTRPRLPWGIRLTPSTRDPRRGLAVIDRLVDDPSLYVRRSVANHLNDVCKDNPDLALETARRWAATPSKTRAWVIRHGLRTLLKAAHPEALALIGRPPVDVGVEALTAGEAVAIGARLPFSLVLHNRQSEPAVVRADYLMHLVKKDGKRRPKAYSLADITLAPGERRTLERNHDFKRVTTRTYYPGEHRIEVRVNGAPQATVDFTLTAE